MRFLTLILAFLALATPGWAMDRGVLNFSNGKKLDYYRTHTSGTAIKHLVVPIHGTNRNAGDYATYAERALKKTAYRSQTAIWVPQFGENKRTGYLYWPGEGDTDNGTDWQYGGGDRSSNFSSYQVLDEIVAKALAAFPNVQRITIVGHSAGGQMVQRYAVGTNLQVAQLRFLPMNAGSYMYLGPERKIANTWTVPSSCSGYNTYRYGLINMSPYMRQMTLDWRFKPVTVLSGTLDTKADSDMDKTCQAMLQGKNRRERALIFNEHQRRLGGHWGFQDVPGVGHSASGMFMTARETIFSLR